MAVILSERSERKDRFRATAVKPWMDSDPFVASLLRMTAVAGATQDDPPERCALQDGRRGFAAIRMTR